MKLTVFVDLCMTISSHCLFIWVKDVTYHVKIFTILTRIDVSRTITFFGTQIDG